MSSKRASVSSQTFVQPLILATHRSSSSISRQDSARSKRDSGFDYSPSLLLPIPSPSLKRLSSGSDTPWALASDAIMAPSAIYKLYPQQQPPLSAKRSLHPMESSSDATITPFAKPRSASAEPGASLRPRTAYPYRPDGSRASLDDDGYVHQDPLPSEPDLGTPTSDQEKAPISPMVSDSESRYDSGSGAREHGRRGVGIARSRYDHSAPKDDQRYAERSDPRLPSQFSATPRFPPNTLRPSTASRKPSVVSNHRYHSRAASPDDVTDNGYGVGDRSSADSVMSQETAATSVSNLPALQTKGPDNSDVQYLEPVTEDDPRSWDLVEPPSDQPVGVYALERRAEQMFSAEHLHTIFRDPKLLLKFTGFLNAHRPKSIAILIYYLDALKAIRAIEYANAVAESLEPIQGHEFTNDATKPTRNKTLEAKAAAAFDALVEDDLPAFIAHTWIQVVSISIQRRITGTMAPHLREASEGLAEVFCLTDPSRPDNPIVFASEEFVRTTQYGVNYTIGRNCRFLQGPKTNPSSVRRLAMAVKEGREHTEVFVNYRRDGSPFMNLLMIAPLMDSRGNVRYHIGAQVDVSGLVKECSNLDGLQRMVEKEQDPEAAAEEEEANRKDEFQELAEMFNTAELETARRYGGRMHKEYVDDSDRGSIAGAKRRVLIKDNTHEVLEKLGAKAPIPPAVREKINGRLEGVYQNYLLIRPAPSLRILFTSPSLRVPGILQSPFLDRIGGSSRVRSDLQAALGEGRGVTAKIRWLTRADNNGEGEGRPRWIHCTPLFGHSGAVGVWMVVLVDDEGAAGSSSAARRFRNAPPVATNIGGKEWEPMNGGDREREKIAGRYELDGERRGGSGAGASGTGSGLRPDPLQLRQQRVVSPMRGWERNTAPGSSGTPQKPGTVGDMSEFSIQLK